MPQGVDIRVRRGLASAWTSTNPVLADGEMGLEADTEAVKFGDGTTPWTGLPYSGFMQPGGIITLTNPTSNAIEFGNGSSAPGNGAAMPVGQKLTLARNRSAADGDYAIGINGDILWYSLGASTNRSHRFYVANTLRLTVGSTGCAVSGALSATSITTTAGISGQIINGANYQNGSSIRTADLTISSTTSATNLMDCSAAARAVTLYNSAALPGQRFTLMKWDNSANVCTIQVASAGTIKLPGGTSVSTLTLSTQYDSIEVEATATAGVWLVVNDERRDRQFGLLNVGGASKLGGYASAAADYTVGGVVIKYIEITAPAKTVTLPPANLFGGFDYYIINSSTGSITVQGSAAGHTIGNSTSATQQYSLPAGATLHVVSNGSVWRVL